MYICLEGIDGSGKSTQIKYLKEWLINLGHEVEDIVEPTDSEIGKLIRKILQDPNAESKNTQKILALLFAADRLQIKEKKEKIEKINKIGKIGKEEEKSKIIISDRSFYSSLVYQDPKDWILTLNKFVKIPDLVLLLDIDVEIAISRCFTNDTFENEKFLKNVREKYLELGEKPNFKIINANNGENMVARDIKKAVAPLIGVCSDNIL